jgi:lysophospholipase L1-like esterase
VRARLNDDGLLERHGAHPLLVDARLAAGQVGRDLHERYVSAQEGDLPFGVGTGVLGRIRELAEKTLEAFECLDRVPQRLVGQSHVEEHLRAGDDLVGGLEFGQRFVGMGLETYRGRKETLSSFRLVAGSIQVPGRVTVFGRTAPRLALLVDKSFEPSANKASMLKNIVESFAVSTFLLVATSADAAVRTPTHVACVGDSITAGVGASSSTTNYPAVLQTLLGSSVKVMNFGHSGATMLSVGDLPYQQQSEYTGATSFVSGAGASAVVDVIIMLGTNDSKPYNWTVGTTTRAEQFRKDCAAMVDHFAQLAPHPLVYLALPPHAYNNTYQISGTVLHDQIIPVIKQVAADKGIPVIDVDTPTTGHPELFPDGVHPNDNGYKLVAQVMHDGLLAPLDSGDAGAGDASGAGGQAGTGGAASGGTTGTTGTGGRDAGTNGSGGGAGGGSGLGGASGTGGSSSQGGTSGSGGAVGSGSAGGTSAAGGSGSPAGGSGSGGSANATGGVLGSGGSTHASGAAGIGGSANEPRGGSPSRGGTSGATGNGSGCSCTLGAGRSAKDARTPGGLVAFFSICAFVLARRRRR